MINNPRKLIGILLVLLLATLVVLVGCSKQESVSETSEETIECETKQVETKIAIESETEQEIETESIYELGEDEMLSYLTGEIVSKDVGMRRPLAVMISNDKQSCPQYGFNRASVIYEAPVEGTMNRYMALFEDYSDIDRIGSIRSCRTYYVFFAKEWDAVYAHFGQSTFAKPYLYSIDNINGVENEGGAFFYRTTDKKAPHNAYTSGELIDEAIDKFEYRTQLDESYIDNGGHFKFSLPDEEIFFEEGLSLDAASMYPGYPLNEPWFAYDGNDGLYHRYQYGDVQCGDEGPITVKNVIFQYAPTGTYADTEYLNIELRGESYGYYFTNGRCMPVSVKKNTQWGKTQYYDMEGNEIVLNPGKTWICIIQSSKFDKTEIFDINGNKSN